VNKDSDRIEVLVSEKRVKLHIFEPTQRKIWTVVGKGEEHWVDPDANYCSCPGFYFGKLNGKTICYHLESVELAKKENKIEQIIFSDDEFSDFLFGLISDL
jgi:predicted nucleic acid-binding Zn finger protein|tara:strand:- start:499 stop:801 length:303 start_codon:yes stop_codon:yes gene_type:complete